MMRSTVLYTCNNSGFHDVNHAVKFGTVVYDWSNAKALWANAHPMDSQELITKQAEAVLKVDAGIPGQGPRVWAYRNTIKALNWCTYVREQWPEPHGNGPNTPHSEQAGETLAVPRIPATTWSPIQSMF